MRSLTPGRWKLVCSSAARGSALRRAVRAGVGTLPMCVPGGAWGSRPSSPSLEDSMFRRISAVAAALIALFLVSSSPARADDGDHATHKSGGIGFHEISAPLGVRWWLANQKVGIDLGFGFGSSP